MWWLTYKCCVLNVSAVVIKFCKMKVLSNESEGSEIELGICTCESQMPFLTLQLTHRR